jgi:hypothetical protein
MYKIQTRKFSVMFLVAQLFISAFSQVPVDFNAKTNRIKIQDHRGNLVLKIDCNNKCVIDNVETYGNAVVSNQYGVFSSINCNGNLYSTAAGIQSPTINTDGNSIIINGIIFGEKNNLVSGP